MTQAEAHDAITAMHRAIDGMEKMADINPVDEALAYLAFRICGLRNRALFQRLGREAEERVDALLKRAG